jgi:surface protein
MQAMFYGCSSLKELDLSGFNTRNVTNMSYMFKGCSSLEQVDLSSFNTANVTEMEDMFWDCGALKELNLNNFNMGKVKTTKNMFNGCTVLKTIYCNDIWPKPTTSSVNMFAGCLALVGGNETAYSGSYTDITYARLDGYGDLKGYFTATAEVYTEYEDGVLTYRYDDQRHKSYKTVEKYDPEVLRFEGYRSDIIKAVIDPSMKDANLKTTAAMFYGRSGYSGYGLDKLETIEGLENLHTENVLDMGYMFREAVELTELDLSNFNTAKVENMRGMFEKCE